MQIHTEAVAFKADSKLHDYIQQRLEKMEQFIDQIIEANVTLKLENSGQIRDKIAEVRLRLPGRTLVAKSTAKTFEASIDQTLNALRRQVIRHKGKKQTRNKGKSLPE